MTASGISRKLAPTIFMSTLRLKANAGMTIFVLGSNPTAFAPEADIQGTEADVR